MAAAGDNVTWPTGRVWLKHGRGRWRRLVRLWLRQGTTLLGQLEEYGRGRWRRLVRLWLRQGTTLLGQLEEYGSSMAKTTLAPRQSPSNRVSPLLTHPIPGIAGCEQKSLATCEVLGMLTMKRNRLRSYTPGRRKQARTTSFTELPARSALMLRVVLPSLMRGTEYDLVVHTTIPSCYWSCCQACHHGLIAIRHKERVGRMFKGSALMPRVVLPSLMRCTELCISGAYNSALMLRVVLPSLMRGTGRPPSDS
jgi:small nuclear ribonucleoprotein (snRNP)-like protein